MRSRLRLVLLLLAFAVSLVLAPVEAFAAQSRAALAQRPFVLDLFAAPNPFGRERQHAPRLRPARAVTIGLRAVGFARHLLGIRYTYGGSSPSSGFDCSGFVRFVYAHYGIHLPHSSYADFDLGRRVARGALRPGDGHVP